MSNQPGRAPQQPFDLRGAVDLGALAARNAAPATNGASTAGGSHVIEATDATFMDEVMATSRTVPVVIDFWATWCQPCKQLSPVLEKLAAEFDGRFLLVKMDVDANPQVAQAFQIQSIPSVFAVLKEQPVPLFQGAQPEPQIHQVLTELLRVAEANGVTGRHAAGEDGDDEAEEPVEEPLPPHHQAAYDAIENGDYDAAVLAYESALRENPADDEARIGLAQVGLLRRTQEVDPVVARDAAAADRTDVDAQILVADLDLLGGHVEDAFARLIDTVRVTAGPQREQVRKHLIELFDVVGANDPRVAKARLTLANALF
jgi:putative thioredoxin